MSRAGIAPRKPFFEKTYSIDHKSALEKIESVAKKRGFGVVTIHDMRETYRRNGHDFPPCPIVELCRPSESYEALSRDVRVGHMIPKKILVYQDADTGDHARTAGDYRRERFITEDNAGNKPRRVEKRKEFRILF